MTDGHAAAMAAPIDGGILPAWLNAMTFVDGVDAYRDVLRLSPAD